MRGWLFTSYAPLADQTPHPDGTVTCNVRWLSRQLARDLWRLELTCWHYDEAPALRLVRAPDARGALARRGAPAAAMFAWRIKIPCWALPDLRRCVAEAVKLLDQEAGPRGMLSGW